MKTPERHWRCTNTGDCQTASSRATPRVTGSANYPGRQLELPWLSSRTPARQNNQNHHANPISVKTRGEKK